MLQGAQKAHTCLICNLRRSTRIKRSKPILRWFSEHSVVERELPFRKTLSRKPREVESLTSDARGRGGKASKDLFRNGRTRRSTNVFQKVEAFENVVPRLLERMKGLLHDPAFQAETGLTEKYVDNQFFEVEKVVTRAVHEDPRRGTLSRTRITLMEAYKTRKEDGLWSQLKFMLQAKLANAKFQQSDIVNQIKLADLRYPSEWYPYARRIKRTIHLHIGPTNSGKTYNALKRLEEAKSGCYAGPLRLLAHEVYTRLNAKGKKCNLVTGDEIVVDEDSQEPALSSCTVEMVPFSTVLDVAVIDEIQMIGDENRGWAWTQAVLGLAAKELHLCGEARTLPLIREIAASLGEELVVHNYERLSPLKVADRSLGGRLENLQKGDCVVSFSRKVLHQLKKGIEAKTGNSVAIVYGALPPEIRAQQAKLFNDQDNNYDVLVASDAIGMGLNLSVKRIVFETLFKFDGSAQAALAIAQVKQIGGRAGRYRTAAQANVASEIETTENSLLDIVAPKPANPNIGYVTTLHDQDLPRLRKSMQAEAPPITSAGLTPPESLVNRFSSYFPAGTPLSYILLRLNEISRMHSRYFLCDLKDAVAIADAIQQVEGLTISERMMFCYAPADCKNPLMKKVLVAYARAVASRTGGGLLDIPEIKLEVLDLPMPDTVGNESYITSIATAHQAVVLYLWLSYRMNSVFYSQALAFHTKLLLQEKLDAVLTNAKWDQNLLKKRQRSMATARKQVDLQQETTGRVDDEDDPTLARGLAEDFEQEDGDIVIDSDNSRPNVKFIPGSSVSGSEASHVSNVQ